MTARTAACQDLKPTRRLLQALPMVKRDSCDAHATRKGRAS